MKYLLDTNVCIRFLAGRSIQLSTKFAEVPASDKLLCSVVVSELFYGAYRSQQRERTMANLNAFLSRFISLPFDDAAARAFGEIRATLAASGTPIGPYDLQIAAIALVNNVTLVTHNTGEFSRVASLVLEDWEL